MVILYIKDGNNDDMENLKEPNREVECIIRGGYLLPHLALGSQKAGRCEQTLWVH